MNDLIHMFEEQKLEKITNIGKILKDQYIERYKIIL